MFGISTLLISDNFTTSYRYNNILISMIFLSPDKANNNKIHYLYFYFITFDLFNECT